MLAKARGALGLDGVRARPPTGPGMNRVGSVGLALSGVEVSVADDGELLIRGPIVIRGYRRQPEQTAEAVESDGWLHR